MTLTEQPAPTTAPAVVDPATRAASPHDAEVDALRAEVERLRQRPASSSGGWRRIAAGLLAVVAGLGVVLAAAGWWARDTLLHTDDWVAAVGPLPEQPAVAEAVAAIAVDELAEHVDLQAEVVNLAGPDARPLAGPITSALEDQLRTLAVEVIESPEFRETWEAINRTAHEEALLVLRGDGELVSAGDGQVTLNLIPLVNSVLVAATADASSLLGADFDPPEVTADDADAAREALSSELGVELPEDFAQLTVYDDGVLGEAQQAVRFLDDTSLVLVVAAVLAIAATMAISDDRRRSLVTLAVSAVAFTIVGVAAAGLVEDHLLGRVADPTDRAAVGAAVDVALGGLDLVAWWVAGLAVVVAVLGALAGPGPLARRIRTEAPSFVQRHRRTLQVAGVAVALAAFVLPARVTGTGVLVTLVALGLYLLALAVVPDEPEAEPTAEPPTDRPEIDLDPKETV